MNTETFVGSLHKQKEVLQQEQQIFLFTEFTWQDEKNLLFSQRNRGVNCTFSKGSNGKDTLYQKLWR